MATHTPLRDPARTFTPLGRPFRKPRKVVASLSSLASCSDIDDFYFLERPQPRTKIPIGLQECRESRPPLQMDVVGPTPCTYTVPQPPLSRVGGKINPLAKYERDAPPRPNSEVWTLNVATLEKTPSPCSYGMVNGLGSKSPTKKTGPAYSMTGRAAPKKTNSSVYPAPNLYNAAKSNDYISRHFPSFRISSLKPNKRTESSPGPAHYHPKHSACQHHSPSFTFRKRTITA